MSSDAYSRQAQQIIDQYHATIASQDDELRRRKEALVRFARDLIDARVRITELEKLLNECDVYVIAATTGGAGRYDLLSRIDRALGTLLCEDCNAPGAVLGEREGADLCARCADNRDEHSWQSAQEGRAT